MIKEFKFMYDDFSDRLMIATKKEVEVIAGSVRILNTVLDFTAEGRIANIELFEISDYLESMGISSSILNKITGAEFSFRLIRNGYLIMVLLKNGKKIERIPYNIHLPNKNQILLTQF